MIKSVVKTESETQDRTIEKEESKSAPKARRKNNLLVRATELLKDSLLDFKDKSKKANESDEGAPETELVSALEDPKYFMKTHFPVIYPYTKKKNKLGALRTLVPKQVSNFALCPDDLNIVTESNSCRKVWSPSQNNDLDCKYLLYIYSSN
jgi:hypothetical protein